jgi:hypothetical protein
MWSDAIVIDERADTLVAGCANCVGFCCVALAFARSDGFGFDKDTGEECGNLTEDFRCGIHTTLRADGFKAVRCSIATAPGRR